MQVFEYLWKLYVYDMSVGLIWFQVFVDTSSCCQSCAHEYDT